MMRYHNKISTIIPMIKIHKKDLNLRPIIPRNFAINKCIGEAINNILGVIKNNYDLKTKKPPKYKKLI